MRKTPDMSEDYRHFSTGLLGHPRKVVSVVSARRGVGLAVAVMAVVAGLVLASVACTTHQEQPGKRPATLTAAPPELGQCAPEALARCVPRLADVDENLFDAVSVFAPTADFAAMPPGAAADAAPEGCQHLPRLGGTDKPELDVQYQPATDAHGIPFGNRFPMSANARDSVRVRLTVAGDGEDVTSGMAAWTHQCPMWGIAATMNDDGIHGWLVAESREALSRYQEGEIASQWPYVTSVAATILPSRVIVQAWYRTDDPSAASRNELLSQLIGAAGRPRPRSALPPKLAAWSGAQISTLLPPLSMNVGIDTGTSGPVGQLWSICPSGDRGPRPRYDTLASWHDFDPPAKWDQPGKPPRPRVTVNRAYVGVDYLAELRHEIVNCTAHLAEKPPLCVDRENRQFLQSGSAVAEGEDTVRFTQRWLREEEARDHRVCSEGVEAMRVTQVRGLIVISSASQGGYLFRGDTPPLPLTTLDELLAETVREIKAA